MAGLVVLLLFGARQAEAASITMSRTSATISKGSSIKLQVLSNGKAVSGAVWGSSDSAVAAVSKSGKVTGKLKGSTVITATWNGSTVECIVSVVNKTKSETIRYNVLILDRSHSMHGSPMTQVKKAAKRFARVVMDADGTNYTAVVSFSSKASTDCTFTTSYKKVAGAIDKMSSKGDTNMRAAFDKAFKLLKKAPSGKNVIKNVILCSDGLPRKGKTLKSGKYTKQDHKYYKYANAVYKTDKQMKDKNYFIYALGFFHNSTGKSLTFGKQLMKDLASKDKYYIIQKPKDITDAFEDIAEKITSVTISDTSITLREGESKTLTAYLNGVKASGAAWTSDNPLTAKVNQSGKVTGVKAGTTKIRAAVQGKTVTCKVKVLELPTTIELNKKSVTLYVGQTATVKATVTGADHPVSWSSDAAAVASVSGNGKSAVIKGLRKGSCTVKAVCNGKSASCKVIVKEAEDLTKGFELYGEAVMLDDKSVRLTECATWRSGGAWYPKTFSTTKGLTMSFQFRAGGGRDDSYGGADGIALNFAKSKGIGAQGEDLGFTGEYGVELDSYPHNGGDPDKKHIAIIKDRVSNHLSYVEDDRVDDSKWHTLKVVYRKKTLGVYLDGKLLLTEKNVELAKDVYIGITAATGGGKNEHRFRNFRVYR